MIEVKSGFVARSNVYNMNTVIAQHFVLSIHIFAIKHTDKA